jgi:hypothetical protein
MSFAVALVALSVAAAGGSAGDVRAGARAILGRPGYQTELPLGERTPSAPRRVARAAPAPAFPNVPALGLSPSFAAGFAWGLAGLLLAAGLAWMLMSLRLPPRKPRAGRAVAKSRPKTDQGPAAPAPVADFERLAAQGRFGEAIHALLLRALTRVSLAPALTGREALEVPSLGAEVRTALAPLVREVERVWFAGGTALQDDYLRCREHWQRFVAACRPRAT